MFSMCVLAWCIRGAYQPKYLIQKCKENVLYLNIPPSRNQLSTHICEYVHVRLLLRLYSSVRVSVCMHVYCLCESMRSCMSMCLFECVCVYVSTVCTPANCKSLQMLLSVVPSAPFPFFMTLQLKETRRQPALSLTTQRPSSRSEHAHNTAANPGEQPRGAFSAVLNLL